MIRTVVAFEKDESRDKIADMLEKSGVTVRYRCRSGAEVLRAVKTMGSGVVICGHKLTDMPAEHLAHDLRGQAKFLVLAKQSQLELLSDPDIFKLQIPISAAELRGSVNILIQLDEISARAQIPQRSQEEQHMIDRAKEALMEKRGFTEAQAHKYLQKRSMETGTKLAETARLILEM